MKHFTFSILVATTLAACGGSSSGPTFVTVPASFSAVGDSDINIELTPSGETIIVNKDGTLAPVATATSPDIGTFKTAVDPAGDYTVGIISQSDTSVAALSAYDDGTNETSGAIYQRIGDTDLPTDGSATFNGDYVGLLIDPLTNGSESGLLFQGDATIAVDFEAATVSGDITDRDIISLLGFVAIPDSSVADMALLETELSATGEFIGDIDGGAFSVDGGTSTVAADSSYEGLIAGADATEAVGAIIASHEFDGDQYIELGSFAAGH